MVVWKSLSHLSITGRSLLLQAILYGSLRYWLFTMRMPESLHVALDKDSYNLLWAQQPEILSDEDGTTAKSRAYIHRRASFLPQKQGGGGVMHFRSHAQAYYTPNGSAATWNPETNPGRKSPTDGSPPPSTEEERS